MKRSTITGHPGFAVIRDQRGWHGGTPNTSSEPRYMPDVMYVLRDAPAAAATFLNMTAPSAGKWIAESRTDTSRDERVRSVGIAGRPCRPPAGPLRCLVVKDWVPRERQPAIPA